MQFQAFPQRRKCVTTGQRPIHFASSFLFGPYLNYLNAVSLSPFDREMNANGKVQIDWQNI